MKPIVKTTIVYHIIQIKTFLDYITKCSALPADFIGFTKWLDAERIRKKLQSHAGTNKPFFV